MKQVIIIANFNNDVEEETINDIVFNLYFENEDFIENLNSFELKDGVDVKDDIIELLKNEGKNKKD